MFKLVENKLVEGKRTSQIVGIYHRIEEAGWNAIQTFKAKCTGVNAKHPSYKEGSEFNGKGELVHATYTYDVIGA